MDLFVLPSLFEGLGIVLIEAQANGLHSVASENVPQEVNHGDAIKFVELSKKKWIEEILMEYKQSRKRQRTNYVDYLKKDGYDIHMAACELEKKYQELVWKWKNIVFIKYPCSLQSGFFNKLSEYLDVTVIFEAKGASSQGNKFDWNDDRKIKFKCIHLSEETSYEKSTID